MRRLHVVRSLLVVAAAALLLVGAPGAAGAHSGAFDMKYIDGSNLVLVTFNTHQPVSGLAIRHNIRLYDLMGTPIPYEVVDVAVHTRGKDSGITLRGHTLLDEQTLQLDPTNDSTLTYTYPRAGAYSLLVTFRAGGRDISHGEFAVDVGQGTSTGALAGLRLPQTLAAFLVGLACYHLVARRRRGPADIEGTDQSPHDANAAVSADVHAGISADFGADLGADLGADIGADRRAAVDGSHVPA